MRVLRRVAIIGGNRIPFARSNGPYARASNQMMLTAALEGLIERFNLHGLRMGEVAAGAVLKHARDFNLTRECVLGSRLSPQTPAYDIQQACGTGLEAALMVANKIALGQIECGIAGGVDTTSDAPIAVNEGLRRVLLEANRGKSTGEKLKALLKLRPSFLKPELPRNGEPRTGLSMGEHCELMAQHWGIARGEQDELALRSHQNMAAAFAEGWHTDLLTPFQGLTREFFQPLLRSLDRSAHIVILGRAPEQLDDVLARVAQRALEGFSRSLAKELRNGGTLQLLYVAKEAEDQLEGALRFFLSPKSAFISGQALRLEACDSQVQDWTRPLAGRKALVTGAARGIGASIAETLARDGADVVLLDVPQASDDLSALAERLGGRALPLDICASDAPAQLLEGLPDGIDIVVHNAGITRDKTLANMTPEYWDSVLAVNLKAPAVLTQALIDAGTLRDGGRIVVMASISGIAGNRGQSNYAASKAGLIGLAQAWAPLLAARGISINAIAPGFIETRMTAAIPFTLREAGRRMSSLGQGGLPQDVAEAVAWLAQPGSGAVSGQVLRVCGQAVMGA